MTSGYKDHIAALAPERIKSVKSITTALDNFIFRLPELQAMLTFTAGRHPTFEDNKDVFAKAVEDIMLGCPGYDKNDIPLLFMGAHIENRFTGTRETIGFIFTDRRVYLQDEVKGVFAVEPARCLSYQDYAPAEFPETLVNSFKWQSVDSIVQEIGFEEIKALLNAIIVEIQRAIESTPDFVPAASAPEKKTIKEKVKELGLTAVIKFADDKEQAKIKAKIEKKFNIEKDETLLWFAIDTILIIGSVYGLAVTDKAVYSKDLMEEPLRTAIKDIHKSTIRLVDKDGILFNGEIKHLLPNYLDDRQKETLVTILKQYL